MNDDYLTDQNAEELYDLHQENIELRSQITYLQEHLYIAEDEIDKITERLESKIAELEEQLCDALYSRSS